MLRLTLLGALMVATASVSLAQDTKPIQPSEFFLTLQQLQEANLGVSQKMSETQVQAASLLERAIADGRIDSTAERRLSEALIANARMLASFTYSPVAARDAASTDAYVALLDRNLQLVRNLQGMAGASAGFRSSLSEYATLQVQTQDLGLALRNGWARYDNALAEAQSADVLPGGSFDPATRTWTLQLPEILPTIGGTPVATAEPKEPVEAVAPIELAAAPEPEVRESVVAPEVIEPLVEPEPAPEPEIAVAEAPADSDVAVVEPPAPEVASAEESVTSSIPEVVEKPAEEQTVAESVPAASESWIVGVESGSRTMATAASLGSPEAAAIKAVVIGCSPNGTLRYTVESDKESESYYIFVDETRGAEVVAESNVVAGSEAIRMSDALRLAFETATKGSGAVGRIAIASSDAMEEPAYLPVLGYLEARGRVLDRCAPWTPSAAEVATTVSTEQAPLTPSSAAAEAPDSDTAPPIFYTRPTNRQPVNLLNGG